MNSLRDRGLCRLDHLADDLELGPVGRFEPFEEHGLGGRNDRPGLLHPAKGELPVEPISRGDGVGGNLDPEAQVEKLDRGLGHADVRFDAKFQPNRSLPEVSGRKLLIPLYTPTRFRLQSLVDLALHSTLTF